MASVTSLISKFERANLSGYPDVTKYDCPLDAGLWVLWVYKEKLHMNDEMTANEISQVLRGLGVSFKAIALTRAFARAGAKLHAQTIENIAYYMIMKKGVEYLRSKFDDSNITVYYIEGNKPRTDRNQLKNLISAKGEIKIVDKFYGRESLDLIETLAKQSNIKWLTAVLSTGEDESKFSRELSRLKTEFDNVEIRKHAKAYELHDRYIITKESLILLGHGLKDLGNKESFVIVFMKEMGEDIRSSLSAKFEEKWQKASNLR